jgi:glyoxylase-like metal-dependent hydrolase (beta-lactamase superfamily II)
MIVLDEESEILPGISVIFAPGHTPGHMVISFSSEGKELVYIGDAVLHTIHLEHPDWLPIYDILPDKAAESKIKIFDLVAKKNSLVIGQHFTPFPSLGRVRKNEIGWEWMSSV